MVGTLEESSTTKRERWMSTRDRCMHLDRHLAEGYEVQLNENNRQAKTAKMKGTRFQVQKGLIRHMEPREIS